MTTDFIYKAKVTKSGQWQRYNVARMGISVGQPYHEGEKFIAACEWVAKRFSKVSVLVADTLQRHNLPGGDTEWNRLISRQAGDAWLARNGKAMDILPNLNLVRWDDLLNDPDYLKYRQHPAMSKCESEYIREEVAIILMLQDREAASEIYPGSFLPIWGQINRSDLSCTRIDFIRVKPQKIAA
jgi:hypothetical protein